jgi:hypothetical protein
VLLMRLFAQLRELGAPEVFGSDSFGDLQAALQLGDFAGQCGGGRRSASTFGFFPPERKDARGFADCAEAVFEFLAQLSASQIRVARYECTAGSANLKFGEAAIHSH